jgi:hypothetical protein
MIQFALEAQRLTPKFPRRDTDFSIAIIKTVFAIAGEEQRAVKVDKIGTGGENTCRSHAQGSADHATD